MANDKKLSPGQRNQWFAQMTRQHMQQLAAQSGAENSRITFDIPKARLLSKIRMLIEGDLKVSHASQTTYVPDAFAPYNLVRQFRVEMNNGFAPFSISGQGLYMYNMLTNNSEVLDPKTEGRHRTLLPLKASSTGAVNRVRFVADLPLTLNDRDPVGLILTQNQETLVTVSVDFGDPNQIFHPDKNSGFKAELTNVTVRPMTETYTVPSIPEALPDLGTLKLVNGTTYTATGQGEQTIKLPTATTYRKLIFYVTDEHGGVDDSFITSDIEIVFNQADIPYRIKPEILSAINQEHYGRPLPKGMYVLDWSAFQGLPGYAGARDYVDTERLTEFWLRLSVQSASQIYVVQEQLSMMRK